MRSEVTRFTNDADKLLNNRSAVDLKEVSVLIERLRLVERRLKDIDTATEPHLREENAEAEFEIVLEYSDRVATCIVRLEFRKNGASLKETTSHEIPAPRTQRTKLPKRELESMGLSDLSETATSKRVIRDFSANIKEANGRYEVKLLCKNEVDLADNRAVAEKGFQQLLKDSTCCKKTTK
ncbi:hypothetical protein HPB50_024816 [Hyalomma asiaticum]|uniref:Uncharacterized protein n=1 Tax=Hyalomma asiaticum TaxID=266040 RepID=A0ACB7TQ63_HYAAI|nr:hypothetical protein HPB50_024816 [Hyalomma asiaticum]